MHPASQTFPPFSAAEARTRDTFLALMWALSHPGRTETLPNTAEGGLALIGEALLDLETNYFTPDPQLAAVLTRTSARSASVEEAAYLFFPTATEADLTLIRRANFGDMLFPDQAATVIINGALDSGDVHLRLTGPGIATEAHLQVGLPLAFWELRQRVIRYPLGWDVFIVDGNTVVGIPRSTKIEILESIQPNGERGE